MNANKYINTPGYYIPPMLLNIRTKFNLLKISKKCFERFAIPHLIDPATKSYTS
jgi:hypothetical protein